MTPPSGQTPTPDPAKEGEFIWCHFPERERPLLPGPRHIAYIISLISRSTGRYALAAYTSSVQWPSGEPLPPGVSVYDVAEARTLGQGRAFHIDMRKVAGVPLNATFFPDLNTPSRGVVGRAQARLQAKLLADATHTFTRHPESVLKLGPLRF